MKEQNIVSNYDLSQSIAFFSRWKKTLLCVFAVALIVFVAASFLITPLFTSTAVIIPSNSNRISKAIMDYHYSMDFMDYGSERDCEYAIQALSSYTMQEAVNRRFNLMEHYEIKADDPHKLHKFTNEYEQHVTIRRTDYLGVKIAVEDEDPQMAADIANYIANYYDTLCHELHHARAYDAHLIMQDVCSDVERELLALEDSIRQHPQYKEVYSTLIADKSKKLADMQTRAAQTKVDMSASISYKFWLDHAVPADKKSSPKRLLIALAGAVGSLLCCIVALMFVEWRRRQKESQV